MKIKNLFKRPTLESAISEELYSARHRLLQANTALDWATSEVAYNTARIKRLEKQQNELTKSIWCTCVVPCSCNYRYGNISRDSSAGVLLRHLLIVLLLLSSDVYAISRETKCLALNIYYEARGESYLGKLAVAKVTINRTKDPKFPDTICDVVYQPGQFSWTAQGPRKTDAESIRIAQRAMRGRHELSRFDALYFHNKSVRPYWMHKFKKIKTIGTHAFYRDK